MALDGLSSSPSLYLDARDASTIELDTNGLVSAFLDKSGNGKHFRTASAAKRMSYSASRAVSNNKPSVFAARGGDTMVSDTILIKTVYIVCAFGAGTETVFNTSTIGWGDGYSTLIGGPPRFMGNVNTGRIISSSAFDADGAFKNRETVKSGSGDTTKPALLPLPLSLLKIVGTSATNVVRYLANQDAGASRAWNGPICAVLAFPGDTNASDDKIIQDEFLYGFGIEAAPAQPIVGTVSKTLGPLTSQSGAKLALQATAAGALGLLTSSAVGKVLLRGSLAKTLGAMTATGRIGTSVGGNVSKTLDPLTVNATGRSPRRAALAATLGPLTALSSGQSSQESTGRFSGNLAPMTASATGRLSLKARLLQTLGILTGHIVGRFFDGKVPLVRVVNVIAEDRTAKAITSVRSVSAIEGNIMLNWPDKDPDERLDYKIDWSDRLDGDTISQSEWIVPAGLVTESQSNTDGESVIWLSGGVARRNYHVLNRVTTAGGRIMDQTVILRVLQK